MARISWWLTISASAGAFPSVENEELGGFHGHFSGLDRSGCAFAPSLCIMDTQFKNLRFDYA
jgi:hypothetical protein